MHRSNHFITFILGAFFSIVIVLATALPASGQNAAVPPTARQAAQLPEFASRLHPTATPQASRQSPAPAFTHRRMPSPQDQVIYDNGPANGTTDAWTINFGYIVSDTFTLTSQTTVSGFDLYVWEFPGDAAITLDWSITSGENGGTVYGSGTANVKDTFISTNQFGYDIDKLTITGLNVSSLSGTVWLNLYNAVVPSGDPVYWDENSGVGCQSQGCPSQAYESASGTIPSEAFDVVGTCWPNCPPQCISDDPKDGFKIIHSFTDKEQSPEGVAPDQAGNLYGATRSGGDYGQGLTYKLTQEDGAWMLTPLYSFTGGNDGGYPSRVILGPEGGLYGGAAGGGIQSCGNGGTSSCGLVYGLRPHPTACLTALCSWMENLLYPFTGNTDAWGGEVSSFGQNGNLYGFSPSGGAYGHGAVFELTPSSGGWTEEVIYSFTGSNGDGVNALLVGSDGNLYGTTLWGGHGGGVVFQLVPSGGGWTEQDIAGFGGCTYYYGCSPVLVQENSGNLYGVASYDQQYYFAPGQYYWDTWGIIFMMSPSDGKWQVTLLDDRANYYNSYGLEDWGYDIFHDLTIDAAGRLYMTEGGEAGGFGFIYWGNVLELPAPYHDRVLVGFGGDNFSNVEVGANANLYGSTSGCGSYGKGTAWELTPQN